MGKIDYFRLLKSKVKSCENSRVPYLLEPVEPLKSARSGGSLSTHYLAGLNEMFDGRSMFI